MSKSIIESWVRWLEENKAEDVQVIDVSEVSDVVDAMVVATAMNTRHIASLSEDAMRHAKSLEASLLAADGLDGREWVVLDFGVYMIHLMLPETRLNINFEEHWVSVIERRKNSKKEDA